MAERDFAGNNALADNQARMAALLRRLAPTEGYTLSPLPDIRFLRCDRPLARVPVLYDPGIVIVCQGKKRGYLGDRVYSYDAQHYLAVSVPVPFTMETDANEREPLLAVYMHLDFNLAAELVLQLEQFTYPDLPAAKPESLMSSPMDTRLCQSVLHLLETLADPLAAPILGPAIVREIYFRVLTGAQGGALRAALTLRGQFGKIAKALERLHATFDQPVSVAQLAGEAGMSVPAFFAHFKAVTRCSPKQYQKSLRLHQARMLMARNQITAAAAAIAVGYESASQFSREFKRLFGLPPAEEAKRMQAQFAVPPVQADTRFISSH